MEYFPCPSVNSFKFRPCDHTPPGTRRLRFPAGRRGGRRARLPPIPGRHRLRLRLRRYLIVFDPLTFVLDRGGRPRQKPSPSSISRQSENFTSDDEVSMAPTVPVDRAPRPRDRRFRGLGPRALSRAATFEAPSRTGPPWTPRFLRGNGSGAPLPAPSRAGESRFRTGGAARVGARPLGAGRTRRGSPGSDYELFNRSNFNIRYRSWNYRGCWHQTCPPIVAR